MAAAVRNLGWPGVCAGAISAVDSAVHDLKARLLEVSLTRLLGGARSSVTAYGSGGFTNYSIAELQEQLSGWAADGFSAVKMKIGTDPEVERLRLVIGAEFVNRFRDAVGEPSDPRVIEAITFAFSGALLQAGMGLMTFDELSQRLDDVVAVIMEGH